MTGVRTNGAGAGDNTATKLGIFKAAMSALGITASDAGTILNELAAGGGVVKTPDARLDISDIYSEGTALPSRAESPLGRPEAASGENLPSMIGRHSDVARQRGVTAMAEDWGHKLDSIGGTVKALAESTAALVGAMSTMLATKNAVPTGTAAPNATGKKDGEHEDEDEDTEKTAQKALAAVSALTKEDSESKDEEEDEVFGKAEEDEHEDDDEEDEGSERERTAKTKRGAAAGLLILGAAALERAKTARRQLRRLEKAGKEKAAARTAKSAMAAAASAYRKGQAARLVMGSVENDLAKAGVRLAVVANRLYKAMQEDWADPEEEAGTHEGAKTAAPAAAAGETGKARTAGGAVQIKAGEVSIENFVAAVKGRGTLSGSVEDVLGMISGKSGIALAGGAQPSVIKTGVRPAGSKPVEAAPVAKTGDGAAAAAVDSLLAGLGEGNTPHGRVLMKSAAIENAIDSGDITVPEGLAAHAVLQTYQGVLAKNISESTLREQLDGAPAGVRALLGDLISA